MTGEQMSKGDDEPIGKVAGNIAAACLYNHKGRTLVMVVQFGATRKHGRVIWSAQA